MSRQPRKNSNAYKFVTYQNQRDFLECVLNAWYVTTKVKIMDFF